MNAATAREHMSRDPEDAVTPVDMPLPDGWTCDVQIQAAADDNNQLHLRATCTGHGDRRQLGFQHSLPELIRFYADHAGAAAAVRLLREALAKLEGRIPAGKDEGEPGSGVGPGPVTVFSSPSSPLITCDHGHADLRCTLPIGHYDQHHAVWHGHSISWPADEAPFGTETDPS